MRYFCHALSVKCTSYPPCIQPQRLRIQHQAGPAVSKPLIQIWCILSSHDKKVPDPLCQNQFYDRVERAAVFRLKFYSQAIRLIHFVNISVQFLHGFCRQRPVHIPADHMPLAHSLLEIHVIPPSDSD